VSEFVLSASSGLDDIAAVQPTDAAGVTVRIFSQHVLTLVSAARSGGRLAVSKISKALGVALPETPRVASTRQSNVLWAGPSVWLVVTRDGSDGVAAERALSQALGKAAAVVDLSDSRILLEVSGPKARALFEKGLPLDLHPRAFRLNDTAIAMLCHVPVQIWQVDDQPKFQLFVPRATAGHIWHWLEESAAEFDLRVERVA
jgi:methylglutamate dehydrogenase subunit D